MDYISAKEAASKWGVSEVITRKYCRQNRIPGAKYQDGVWLIPEQARKPKKIKRRTTPTIPPLAQKLIRQKTKKNYHGLYDYVQINLTYSSSRMASNRLTRNQVESIFKKGKVCELFEPTKASDIVEAMNHCVCIDYLIDNVNAPLSHRLVMQLHYMLMFGTVDHRKKQVVPGVYRSEGVIRRNRPMPPAEKIDNELKRLIQEYENRKKKDISTILEFHVRFEQIVPFEDGNGRIGRLIMFKECLRNDITPFIIDDKHRSQYLAGLAAWEDDQTMLMRVVIRAQERFTRQLKRQASRESYWRKPGETEDDNVEDFCDEEEDDNENA